MTNAFEKIQTVAEELRHLIAECEENINDSFRRHMDETANITMIYEKKKDEVSETAQQEKKNIAELLEGDLSFLKEIDEKIQKVDGQFQEKYNAFAQKKLKGYEKEALLKVRKSYDEELEKLKRKRQEVKDAMEKENAKNIDIVNKGLGLKEQDLETSCLSRKNALDAGLKDSLDGRLLQIEEWLKSVNPQELERTVKMIRGQEELSVDHPCSKIMPDYVTLGQMVVDLEMKEPEGVQTEIRQMAMDIRQEVAGKLEENLYFLTSPFFKNSILFPYAVSFEGGLVNHVITYDATDSDNRQAALDYLNAIEAMLFMRIECGMMKTTMMDPMDSAWNFAAFASLGNIKGELVSDEIATTEAEIVKHVNDLEAEIKQVNTSYLSESGSKTILEYNEKHPEARRPLHFVFIADFPHGFQEETLQNLKRIMKNGPRCGIYTFLVAKSSEVHGAGGLVEEILEYATEIAFPSPDYCVLRLRNEVFPMIPIRKPEEEVWNAVKLAIGEELSGAGNTGEVSKGE